MAHFFENLLKSNNKKDKKTALFSLIETFSDSFDEREIQKIRKIITSNDNDGSDKEDNSEISREKPVISAQEEEIPVVGSTTDDNPKPKTKLIRSISDIENSTPKVDQQVVDILKSQTDHKNVPVDEAVINNRQLIDNSKPEKLNKNQTDENINIKEKTKIGDECTIDTNNAESVINADEKTSSDKTIGDSISEPDTSEYLAPMIVSVGERI